jgi:hypothetical protein
VQKDGQSTSDFTGIEEFRAELAESYISVTHGRPAGAGGGLYELVVEFVSTLTLLDVAKFLLGGIAYDLIKSGSKAFILRPFLTAYGKLRDRNRGRIDIGELRFIFQDSVLVIYKISNDSISTSLQNILTTFAKHSPTLTLESGERSFEIHIPVFEDPVKDHLCKFRVLLDVDETIKNITPSDYFKFWGVENDYARWKSAYYLTPFQVYEVERRLLIAEEFYTLDRYWTEWRKREAKHLKK